MASATKRGQETATPASAARPRHRSRADDKENAALEDGAPEDPRLACIKALRDEVTCAVCLDICVRPCTTSCGHNFCRACLRRCLELNQPCPKCRTRLPSGFQLAINTTLHNMIQQLFPAEANAKPLTPPPQQAPGAWAQRPAHAPQPQAHRNPAAPFRPPRFAAAGGAPQPVFTGLSSSRANVGLASAIGRSVSGPRPQRLPITSAPSTGAGMSGMGPSASAASSQAARLAPGGIFGLAELGVRPGGGGAAGGRGEGPSAAAAAAAARRERRRSRSAERWEGGEPPTASVSGPLSFVQVAGGNDAAVGPVSRPVRSSDGRPSAGGRAGPAASAAAAGAAAALPAARSGSGSLLADAIQTIAEAGGARGRLQAPAAESATSLSLNPFMRNLRPIQTVRAAAGGAGTGAAGSGSTAQVAGVSQGAGPSAGGAAAHTAAPHIIASQRALMQARGHLPHAHAPSTGRGASGASASAGDSSSGSGGSSRSSSVFGSGSGEGPLSAGGAGAGSDGCSSESGGGGPGAFDDVSMLELEAVPPLPLQGMQGLRISSGPAFACAAGGAGPAAGAAAGAEPSGRLPAHAGPGQLRVPSGRSLGGGSAGGAAAGLRLPAVDTAEDQAAAGPQALHVGLGGRGMRRSDSDVSGAAARDQGSRHATLSQAPSQVQAHAAAAAARSPQSDSDSVITLDALDVLTPAPAGLVGMDVDADAGADVDVDVNVSLSPSAFATPQPRTGPGAGAAAELRAQGGHAPGAAAASPSWEELDALMARAMAPSPDVMDITPPALPRLRLPSRAGHAAAAESAAPVAAAAVALAPQPVSAAGLAAPAAADGLPRLSLPAAALRVHGAVPAVIYAQPHAHVHHAVVERSMPPPRGPAPQALAAAGRAHDPVAATAAAAPAAAAAAAAVAAPPGRREEFDFDPDRPENYDDADNPAAVESFFNSPFFDRRMLWDELRARGSGEGSGGGGGGDPDGGGARGRAAGLLRDMHAASDGTGVGAGAGGERDYGQELEAGGYDEDDDDELDGAGSEVAVSPSWMVAHAVRSGAGAAAGAGALGSDITFSVAALQQPPQQQPLQHWDSVAMLLMGTPTGAGCPDPGSDTEAGAGALGAAAAVRPLRIAVPGTGGAVPVAAAAAAVAAPAAAAPAAPVAIFSVAAAAAALAGGGHGRGRDEDDAMVPATPDDDDHRRESLFARGSEGANYGAILAPAAATAAAALQPVPTAPAEFVMRTAPAPAAQVQPQPQSSGQGQGQGQQGIAATAAGSAALRSGDRGRPIELLSSDSEDEAAGGDKDGAARAQPAAPLQAAAAVAATAAPPAQPAVLPARVAAAAARQAIGRVVAGLRRPRRN